MAYRPLARTFSGWHNHRSILLGVAMCSVGFLLFYLYLRRILRHVDPNAAIPDRVRHVLDSLSEGVIVIDKHGNIVLANSGFRALHPQATVDLVRKRISDLDWLVSSIGRGGDPLAACDQEQSGDHRRDDHDHAGRRYSD